MATKQLTNEHITLLLKNNYVPDSLTEEEKAQARNIAMHRTNVGEVIQLVIRLMEPYQKQINGVDRGIDVIEYMLRKHLKVTDKDFEKAEKAVDKMNKRAQEELVKSYQESLEKLRNAKQDELKLNASKATNKDDK